MERKKFLEAGKICAVSGIHGEVRVDPRCDSPEFLCGFDMLYLKNGEAVNVERARVAKNVAVLKLEGVDTVEAAQKMRGTMLYIDREDVELDEGIYFVDDLIGLECVDAESGKIYGKVTDVSNTGASDIYEITSENGKKSLIPAVPEFISAVDIEGGKLYVTLIDGMIEETE